MDDTDEQYTTPEERLAARLSRFKENLIDSGFTSEVIASLILRYFEHLLKTHRY